ncbi:hypothetical protein GT043_29550 [Streptomyces sp. SID2131]|nr:hypothetical protein [Streptomyces sp. SID2131]
MVRGRRVLRRRGRGRRELLLVGFVLLRILLGRGFELRRKLQLVLQLQLQLVLEFQLQFVFQLQQLTARTVRGRTGEGPEEYRKRSRK